MNEKLFSYGTLQRETIQLATFGRKLEGRPDVLVGYSSSFVPISDQQVVTKSGETHYRNILFTGDAADVIDGTVFDVTDEELRSADSYEADENYERVIVVLKSGTTAWVYMHRQ
jgi:hypothetical protein